MMSHQHFTIGGEEFVLSPLSIYQLTLLSELLTNLTITNFTAIGLMQSLGKEFGKFLDVVLVPKDQSILDVIDQHEAGTWESRERFFLAECSMEQGVSILQNFLESNRMPWVIETMGNIMSMMESQPSQVTQESSLNGSRPSSEVETLTTV